MQETVTNTNERKSLFSSFLEVLEAKEKQAQADRQLQEEKYLRRTQKIYDFHERQRSEAMELQRCVQLVSQHALVLETALRGGGGGGATEAVPLSAGLARQAAGLARAMAACVANATAIRRRLHAPHDTIMDQLLAKMEAELVGWRLFVQRAVEATTSAETTRDNLHNLIAEQRRVVSAVCDSPVLAGSAADRHPDSDTDSDSASPPPSDTLQACSTPIQDRLP